MACEYQDRDGVACKTRLHTLVTAYRQYKDELKKTGNATTSELDKILSDKPSTQSKIVIKFDNNCYGIIVGRQKWKYWDHPEGQQ